jgi:Rrf2 family protein
MNVSQKCQYALRAIFELARNLGNGPLQTARIAESQAIPPKFLELILGELKRGGFVESRRGVRGGYLLLGRPADLTVGEIIRFVDGPLGPVRCVTDSHRPDCALHGSCAFMDMWSRAHEAVTEVFDGTSFQDLIDEDRAAGERGAVDYSI